jgi:hypothetical protein
VFFGPEQGLEIPPAPTNEAPVLVIETTAPDETAEAEPTIIETETVVETAVVPTAAPNFSEIGQSALGQPLEVVQFGDGERAVLFVGGLHAGFAPGGVVLAEELIAHFSEDPAAVPSNVSLFIIPNLNPDSALAPGQLEGRLNGNGVDLNRNWDCRWTADPPWGGEPQPGLGGSQPLSEPEAQALVDFLEQEQMEAVVFWQARASLGLSSPGACEEESAVSRPLALRYGNAADYPVADFEDVTDTIVFGDVTNWLDGQGIPAISVLLPNYLESDFEHNLTAVLAVMEKISEDPEN